MTPNLFWAHQVHSVARTPSHCSPRHHRRDLVSSFTPLHASRTLRSKNTQPSGALTIMRFTRITPRDIRRLLLAKQIKCSHYPSLFFLDLRDLAWTYNKYLVMETEVTLSDFLLTLYWVRVYPTEFQLEAVWAATRKTLREKIHITLETLIPKLNEVKFDERLKKYPRGGAFQNATICVDGIDVPFRRPLSAWLRRRLYTFKTRHFALRWQLATAIATGEIAAFSGPFSPGVSSDIKCVRRSDWYKKMKPGERMVADAAYLGIDGAITNWKRKPWEEALPAGKAQMNYIVSSVRLIVENVNARLTRANALCAKWRHSIKLARDVFTLVVHLTNIDIRSHPMRKKVNRYIRKHCPAK